MWIFFLKRLKWSCFGSRFWGRHSFEIISPTSIFYVVVCYSLLFCNIIITFMFGHFIFCFSSEEAPFRHLNYFIQSFYLVTDCFRWSVASLSRRNHEFGSRSAHVGFVWTQWRWNRYFDFSPFSVIPSLFPSHISFICHRRYIMLDIDSVLK